MPGQNAHEPIAGEYRQYSNRYQRRGYAEHHREGKCQPRFSNPTGDREERDEEGQRTRNETGENPTNTPSPEEWRCAPRIVR